MNPAQCCPSSTLKLAQQHPPGSPHLPGSGQSALGEPEAWSSPWREGPLHWVAGSLCSFVLGLGKFLETLVRSTDVCLCVFVSVLAPHCLRVLEDPCWHARADELTWTCGPPRENREASFEFFFFFWFPLLIISLWKLGFSSSSDCHLKDSSLTQSLCW